MYSWPPPAQCPDDAVQPRPIRQQQRGRAPRLVKPGLSRHRHLVAQVRPDHRTSRVTILDPRCFQNHVRMRCSASQHTTAVSAAATTAKEETIRDMARSPGICYSGISRATGKLLNPLRERRVAELLRVRCELGDCAIRVPAGGDFARRMCPDGARRPMAAACGPPTADHHE